MIDWIFFETARTLDWGGTGREPAWIRCGTRVRLVLYVVHLHSPIPNVHWLPPLCVKILSLPHPYVIQSRQAPSSFRPSLVTLTLILSLMFVASFYHIDLNYHFLKIDKLSFDFFFCFFLAFCFISFYFFKFLYFYISLTNYTSFFFLFFFFFRVD